MMNKCPNCGSELEQVMHGDQKVAELFVCGTLYIDGKYVAGSKKTCNEIKNLRVALMRKREILRYRITAHCKERKADIEGTIAAEDIAENSHEAACARCALAEIVLLEKVLREEGAYDDE
jgi:Zn finger protein HypA/HybF involved in hydrogenase expression